MYKKLTVLLISYVISIATSIANIDRDPKNNSHYIFNNVTDTEIVHFKDSKENKKARIVSIDINNVSSLLIGGSLLSELKCTELRINGFTPDSDCIKVSIPKGIHHLVLKGHITRNQILYFGRQFELYEFSSITIVSTSDCLRNLSSDHTICRTIQKDTGKPLFALNFRDVSLQKRARGKVSRLLPSEPMPITAIKNSILRELYLQKEKITVLEINLDSIPEYDLPLLKKFINVKQLTIRGIDGYTHDHLYLTLPPLVERLHIECCLKDSNKIREVVTQYLSQMVNLKEVTFSGESCELSVHYALAANSILQSRSQEQQFKIFHISLSNKHPIATCESDGLYQNFPHSLPNIYHPLQTPRSQSDILPPR